MDKYKKKNTELMKAMNEYKDNVDMTFEEFLENFAKMDFDDYIKCIRSSLKAPRVFLKRKEGFLKTKTQGYDDKFI